MNAEIIAVGSELLLGQIANTNAKFISEKLAEIGINVYFHTVVGDNSTRLYSAIEVAKTRASILIFTGGLGPTKDDLTKETVASSLKKNLVYNQDSLDAIEGYFGRVGKQMTENNRKQALVIEDSIPLINHHGMAPGMIIQDHHYTYVLLPGPPSEMEPMFIDRLIPYLSISSNQRIVSRVMRFFGIGESALETDLLDLIEGQTNPTIAPLAKQGEVTLRLTAKHESAEQAKNMLMEVESEILSRVGLYFYGYGEKGLPEVVFSLLQSNDLTLAVAESLTGGLFSQFITQFSGASRIFKGSVVCYTNEAKQTLLSISEHILNENGAVSEACAIELAQNVRMTLSSDIGISFTGVAGPTMSEGKDVGTVYIGLSTTDGNKCIQLHLSGTREAIRRRAMLHGFDLVRKYISKTV